MEGGLADAVLYEGWSGGRLLEIVAGKRPGYVHDFPRTL